MKHKQVRTLSSGLGDRQATAVEFQLEIQVPWRQAWI